MYSTGARGSAGELRTQIQIAIEIAYIEKDTGEKWLNTARQISSMITGLMKSAETK
jgi:four helix bundle protein